jgi:hypothetical protein
MLPHDIDGELDKRIRAGLLRIEAERLDGRSRLERAYDVCAMELSRAGWPLSEALLTDTLPSLVYQWAKPWLPTTRQVAGVIGNMLEGWMRLDRPTQPISEAEMREWVKRLLARRVKYWQAEALSPQREDARQVEEESVRDLLIRLQEDYNKKELIGKSGVGKTAFHKWLKNPDSVKGSTATTIVSHLREVKSPSK